jgi:hypothetical protein
VKTKKKLLHEKSTFEREKPTVRSNKKEEGFGNTGTRSEDSIKKIKLKLHSGSGGKENTEDATH